MPRKRRTNPIREAVPAPSDGTESNEGGEIQMSDLFTVRDKESWRAAGGGAQAEKGLYVQLLEAFIGTGERYAEISVTNGHFAGKKTQSVATAIKQARDGKSAPEGASAVKVNSKGDCVFLENTAVAE